MTLRLVKPFPRPNSAAGVLDRTIKLLGKLFAAELLTDHQLRVMVRHEGPSAQELEHLEALLAYLRDQADDEPTDKVAINVILLGEPVTLHVPARHLGDGVVLVQGLVADLVGAARTHLGGTVGELEVRDRDGRYLDRYTPLDAVFGRAPIYIQVPVGSGG